MDWNGSLKSFPSRPETSFNFLYSSNYEPYQGMEMKHQGMLETLHGLVPAMEKNCIYGNQDKKKRLTSYQLDSLERSFQDEIKLDPERKIKLSRELGLQPRQIAVWFQNRRARWKGKQLERLYDALKQDFEVISREKQRLQEEVFKLKAIMREQSTTKKQVSTGYTEISGDETVESTSVGMNGSSNKVRETSYNQIGECNYIFNIDEYNPLVSHPYWPPTATTLLPSYHP